MDLSKFKTSDWLKVGGGAVMLIAGFLTWWQPSCPSGSGPECDAAIDSLGLDVTAFDLTFTGLFPWLFIVAIAVLTVLTVTGTFKPSASLPVPLILVGVSALSFLLVLIRFFADPFDSALGIGGDTEAAGRVVELQARHAEVGEHAREALTLGRAALDRFGIGPAGGGEAVAEACQAGGGQRPRARIAIDADHVRAGIEHGLGMTAEAEGAVEHARAGRQAQVLQHLGQQHRVVQPAGFLRALVRGIRHRRRPPCDGRCLRRPRVGRRRGRGWQRRRCRGGG